MEKQEIEVREETGLASDVSPARWTMMLSQAETIVKSGLAPKADTKETVVVKILAGRELGFSAMQSLRLLYVVGQKVAMMSDATAGLVLQRLPGAVIDCVETTDKIATFEASRPGGKVTRLSFTWAEAQKAGLTGGTGWQKYPAQMLRARCQIAICRLVFPDICAGLYSPDELGDKTLPATDVPIAEQIAKEKERIAKQELKDAGVIKEGETIESDTQILPEAEKPATEAPKPPKWQGQPLSSPGNPATKAQTGYVLKLLDNLNPKQVDIFCTRIKGKPLYALTKQEASELIAHIMLPENQAGISEMKIALIKEGDKEEAGGK